MEMAFLSEGNEIRINLSQLRSELSRKNLCWLALADSRRLFRSPYPVWHHSSHSECQSLFMSIRCANFPSAPPVA